MSEELIIRHCSPTLAGLKCGSLFSSCFDSRETMLRDIRRLNRLLVPGGLRMLPMRYSGGRGTVYVYCPAGLRTELSASGAQRILRRAGYKSESAAHCVAELIRRMNKSDDFPHEIGLFLGYPPEDVAGFITHRGEKCKCTGCWKVYGDVSAAQKRFESFRRCTDRCLSQWSSGTDMSSLISAAANYSSSSLK